MSEQNNFADLQSQLNAIDTVDQNHQRKPNFQTNQVLIVNGQFFRVTKINNNQMTIKTLTQDEVDKLKEQEKSRVRSQHDQQSSD